MTTELRDRIESGDLHFLDGLVLLGTIASQRWFGGKSRDVLDARVLDAGVVPGGPPILAFAIVEVRYGLQTHDLYHLPLGFRPEADNWDPHDRGDRGLDRLRRDRRPRARPPDRRARRGRRAARRRRGDDRLPRHRRSATVVETVRPMGAEQSNSSLVLDERLALKLYRRIEPGMNPELELLRFLTDRGFPHIAALEGYISYEGRPLEATLAILQRFVPSEGDAWELALDTLGSDPGWLPGPRPPARRGDGGAAQRARLRSDRPALRARGAEHRGARAALGVDRRGDRARVRRLAGHRGGGAGRGPRRGGARPAADAHLHRAGRPGDPPPRRLPPRPGALDGRGGLADSRLRGRARALAGGAAAEAVAAARRRGDAALVRVRRVGVGRSSAASSRRRGGRRSAAPSSSTATSPRSRPPCCPPESRRSSGCLTSSSSRRRSTSCATSSATGPTGSRSRSPGSCGCSEQEL